MTQGMAVFTSAFRREVQLLLTRRWDAIAVFLVPFVLFFIVATMLLAGTMERVPVAVVDHDNSHFSRTAISNMQATPGLNVLYSPSTVAEAEVLMRQGKIYSIAYFPAGFSEGAFRRPEDVVMYYNGALMTIGEQAAQNQASAITAAAKPILEAKARSLGLASTALSPPAVQVSIIGNPEFSFELFLGGLMVPGVLHVLAACSAVMAIGRLSDGGSFAALKKATGGKTTLAMLGHLAPYFIIYTLWGLAWTAWMCGYRGWGITGHLPLVMLGTVALVAVSLALSSFLTALLGSADMGFSGTALYAGAAIAFSNGTLPLHDGPVFARTWSQILPFSHYLKLQTEQIVTFGTYRSGLTSLGILLAVTAGALVLAALMIKLRAKRVPKPKPLTFPMPVNGFAAAYLQTFRNLPKALTIASMLILAIVTYAFYYPAAYAGQTPSHLPLAIVSPDNSEITRQLTQDIDAEFGLQVTKTLSSTDEAMTLMRNGEVDGVIIFPSNFEAGLVRGTSDGIAVWVTGGYLVRATAVAKSVSAAVSGLARSKLEGLPEAVRAASLAPGIKEIELFNPTGGYADYAVPAVSILILQQTLLLGSAIIVAVRRENKNEKMRTSARFGLWAALTTIGTMAALFYFGFMYWFHDYPRAGNMFGAIVLAPFFAASVSALGLSLGRLFDQQERVLQVWIATSVPLFFLAGTAWPHYRMPLLMSWLSNLAPSTAGIEAFLRMNGMGATLLDVGPTVLVLLGQVALYGTIWIMGSRRTA